MHLRKSQLLLILFILSSCSHSSSIKKDVSKRRVPKENAALSAGPQAIINKTNPQEIPKTPPISSKERLNSSINNKMNACNDAEIKNQVVAMINSADDLRKADADPWITLKNIEY